MIDSVGSYEEIYSDTFTKEDTANLDALGVEWRGRNVYDIQDDFQLKIVELARQTVENTAQTDLPSLPKIKADIIELFQVVFSEEDDEGEPSSLVYRYDPISGTYQELIADHGKLKDTIKKTGKALKTAGQKTGKAIKKAGKGCVKLVKSDIKAHTKTINGAVKVKGKIQKPILKQEAKVNEWIEEHPAQAALIAAGIVAGVLTAGLASGAIASSATAVSVESAGGPLGGLVGAGAGALVPSNQSRRKEEEIPESFPPVSNSSPPQNSTDPYLPPPTSITKTDPFQNLTNQTHSFESLNTPPTSSLLISQYHQNWTDSISTPLLASDYILSPASTASPTSTSLFDNYDPHNYSSYAHLDDLPSLTSQNSEISPSVNPTPNSLIPKFDSYKNAPKVLDSSYSQEAANTPESSHDKFNSNPLASSPEAFFNQSQLQNSHQTIPHEDRTSPSDTSKEKVKPFGWAKGIPIWQDGDPLPPEGMTLVAICARKGGLLKNNPTTNSVFRQPAETGGHAWLEFVESDGRQSSISTHRRQNHSADSIAMSQDGTVCRSDIIDYKHDGDTIRINYLIPRATAEKIKEAAEKHASDDYNLFFHNCVHTTNKGATVAALDEFFSVLRPTYSEEGFAFAHENLTLPSALYANIEKKIDKLRGSYPLITPPPELENEVVWIHLASDDPYNPSTFSPEESYRREAKYLAPSLTPPRGNFTDSKQETEMAP